MCLHIHVPYMYNYVFEQTLVSYPDPSPNNWRMCLAQPSPNKWHVFSAAIDTIPRGSVRYSIYGIYGAVFLWCSLLPHVFSIVYMLNVCTNF